MKGARSFQIAQPESDTHHSHHSQLIRSIFLVPAIANVSEKYKGIFVIISILPQSQGLNGGPKIYGSLIIKAGIYWLPSTVEAIFMC